MQLLGQQPAIYMYDSKLKVRTNTVHVIFVISYTAVFVKCEQILTKGYRLAQSSKCMM